MSGHVHVGHRLHAADHPFLRGLDPAFVTRISTGAQETSYEAGELLFREGEEADRFFLVFHGKIALEIVTPDRPRTTIQTVGPGEVIGWSWLVPPNRWRFDARAVKHTRVIALRGSVLRESFEESPADGYRFLLRLLPVLGERLEMARVQILDIHGY